MDEKFGRILIAGKVDEESQLTESERVELAALRDFEKSLREMLSFDIHEICPETEPLPEHLLARLERERLQLMKPGGGKTAGLTGRLIPGLGERGYGDLLVAATENGQDTTDIDLKDICFVNSMAAMANSTEDGDAPVTLECLPPCDDGIARMHTRKRSPWWWWSAAAAALFVSLLVPLAYWNNSTQKPLQDVAIKTVDIGGEAPAVLLTPGLETGFTTPHVIWFSTKHHAARVRIRSLEDPSREWFSDARGGELAWSRFSPPVPLNAGKEYILEVLVDEKPVAVREFKVLADATPIEVQMQTDAATIVAVAERLREEGRLRDALMRLGSVTEILRSHPEVRRLREEITAEILAEER